MVTHKVKYMLDVGNNKVVLLAVFSAAYSTSLLTDLGMTALPASGEVEAPKVEVGQGRLAALRFGCFPVALKYKVSTGIYRIAKVLCAPSKADTVFIDARSSTYRGKNIIEVDIPKRRVYVF